MRLLLFLVLLAGAACADIPWGQGVVLSAGQTRDAITVVDTGKDHATVKIGEHTRAIRLGQSEYLGEYRVGLESLTEGRALLKWARAPRFSDAETLLKPYDWVPQGEATLIQFEVPRELGGPAFTHYQHASQALGLDLRQVAGQTIELRKQPLTARTARNNSQIYAFLAVADGRLVGAWLASDAPIAPGIAPLTSRQPLKW